MFTAAIRGGFLLALACLIASGSRAADTNGRSLPSRPRAATAEVAVAHGPLVIRRIGGVDCVSLSTIAGRLGLKLVPKPGGRAVGLLGTGARAELEPDTRDIMVNGLRVFLGQPVMSSGRDLYVSRIDFERCLTPLLRPGMGPPVPEAPKVIVLDPGHGGTDTGAPNPRVGVFEKNVTLDVALRLRKLLETDGYKVVMTRTEDRLPAPKSEDLAVRAEIANRAHADLFVSIHFNVVERDVQRTRGVEVYTYPPAGQHATDWWSGMSKDDPHFEAADQPGNRFDHWNAVCAQALHRELLRSLRTDDRGKKLMHLGVLKSLNCPGVLVEPGVISNDAEARKLKTSEYRDQIAEALRAGIRDYVQTLENCRGQNGSGAATSSRRRSSRSS